MSLTVDELEALVKRAMETLGCDIPIRRDRGGWTAFKKGPPEEDVQDATLPEVIAKLREWATPPKPATLTITVPFSWAEARAGGPSMQLGDIDKVSKACREAIKPWAQS